MVGKKGLLVGVLFVLMVVLLTPAAVVKKAQNSLDDLVNVSSKLRVPQNIEGLDSLRASGSRTEGLPQFARLTEGWEDFLTRNEGAWELKLDTRTGMPALVEGSFIPWIPGAANDLRDESLGVVTSFQMEKIARDFMTKNEGLFPFRPEELELIPEGTVEVGGFFWHVQFQYLKDRIPVEGARVIFRVNNGNLIQFGMEGVNPSARVDTMPSFSRETALGILEGYVGRLDENDEILESGKLIIVPVSTREFSDIYDGELGRGTEYSLCYDIKFRRPGVMGTWRARIDAHSGEILSFEDENRYGTVTGGIYPVSPLDTEVVKPFPSLTISNGTTKYTDIGGNYSFATGTASAALTGKYVKVSDSCGTSSLSTTASPGDLAFNKSTGTDCTTPGVGGAGNTHASRSGYYHLTAWKLKAQTWLPSNTWLTGQLTDNVNLNQTCNAYWSGTTVNMFKSGGGCRNSGELPTVVLHEVGHGLDSNDGSASADYGTGESYGDTNGFLLTHDSCMGTGFFSDGSKCSGYGDACTQCTGIRDVDYAKHTSATAHTPLNFVKVYCPTSSSYKGPCGREGHCEGYIAAEATWDLAVRALPAAGYDANTSWFILERLFYLSRPSASAAFTCNTSTFASDGCGTSSWFTTFRAIDDTGDGTSNGTPHASAIWSAFNAHGIGCSSASGYNTNQTTCSTISQPTLTATAGAGQVSLSWGSVTNATRYWIMRNELNSTAGMMKIAEVTSTSYTDTLVSPNITYYYSVLPLASSNSCFGAMAAVKNATPTGGGTTTYSISGTVSGATASGVTINLTGTATATTTTATDGTYSFSGLANGSYTVTPSKTGYTFSPTSASVTISGANQTGKNFTATAAATYSISGTVSGATASGVTMSLTGASTASTTTATDGTYTFSGLGNGSYTVTPSKSGYEFSPANVAVTISGANQTGKNFTASVSSCSPQTAAYSATYKCPTCTNSGTSCTASTALLQCHSTGEANYPNTLNGSCADGASGTCHSDESIEAITISTASGCMAVGSSVTVTVTCYAYSTTADWVALYYSNSAASPSWTQVGSYQHPTTTGTGTLSWTFTLTGTAGSVQAVRAQMVYSTSTPTFTSCVSGSYNDADDLVFTTAGGGATYSISGTVSGATASGVTMNLTGASTATTTTATDGTYTFSGLANGSYTVTPSKSGYTFSPASTSVTISGANQTGKNFTASSTITYSISGTVSGATASGVTMNLTGAATASTTTATDGTYSFSGLANGTYTITPSKTGYTFSPASTSVTLSGASQTGKNFTSTASGGGNVLTSGVGVSGTVSQGAYTYYTIVVPSGATNLTVTLTGLSADVDLYDKAPSTAGGVASNPTTSSYTGRSWNSGTTNESLSHSSPTYGTWAIGAYGYAAGSYTVTATYMAGGTTYSISGTVSGATASGVTITAGSATTTTATDGSYTLSGLPNGTYTVTPSKSGYTFSPTSISVTISGASQSGKNFTSTASGGGTTTQVLLNPGFESGTTSWTISGTSIGGTRNSVSPRTGSYMASFCFNTAYENSTTDSVYQTVTIDSAATAATLNFYYYIKTTETTTSTAYDKFTVTVENTSGTTLATLLTLSNLNKTSAWTAKTGLNLLAYKGQTVRIRFKAVTDSSLGTQFSLDDLTLNVTK